MGFYDLRLNEARKAQADLARLYSISGFCYYHYWFDGKVLLEKPLQEIIKSGEPDFPFCVCWANENWTRAWDGLDHQVLIKQSYSIEDHEKHIAFLATLFCDHRYIRIEDQPMILIYRPEIIPNLEEMIRIWRSYALKSLGNEIHISAVRNSFSTLTDKELIALGFDSIVDFQPNKAFFPNPTKFNSILKNILESLLPHGVYQFIKRNVTANNIVDYPSLVANNISRKWPTSYVKFPCVFPSWDNSPRRKSATIIQNTNPLIFKKWLKSAFDKVKPYPAEKQIIFINAWNEWAEGCHLEPDIVIKHGFLNAVKSTVEEDRE